MDDTELLITTPEKSTEALAISLPEEVPQILTTPNICIIGVGGAGGNAVNNMIQGGLRGCRFVVANTDAQVMANSLTHERIQLGAKLTHGLGAGNKPEVGKAAAEESYEILKESLKEVNLLFIAAGMGGGTGTGAAPVVAKIAKEMGILTIGVVTKPFKVEGKKKTKIAEAGIEELSKYVDTLIVIPNQNLFLIAGPTTTIKEAFHQVDDILYQGVKSIIDVMLTTMDVQIDFSDFQTITRGMGKAIMGSGEASGEDRALKATELAITNPLLDVSIKGAKGVLISFAGKDIFLPETQEAIERISAEVDEDADIIFGISTDETLEDKIRVSVVATGLTEADKSSNFTEIDSLANKPEPIIISPEPSAEPIIKAEKPSTIFVPATKEENINTFVEDNSDRKDLQDLINSDIFIPEAPIEAPLDDEEIEEKILSEENEENDLLPLIKPTSSVSDREEINHSSQEHDEGKKSKKKTIFSNVFFPNLFNEKALPEQLKEQNAEQLSKTNKLKTPVLPEEEELNIPAFFRH